MATAQTISMRKAPTAAGSEDRMIREVKEEMLAASMTLATAKRELNAILKKLERHPDYIKSKAREKAGATYSETLTVAFWLHESVLSVLVDAPLDEAADWLVDDQNHAA